MLIGTSWIKKPLWLAQNRLERGGRVWKPSAVFQAGLYLSRKITD